VSQAESRVFAGIDEAGLGPLLGPMTVGWSAFRVPRGQVNLWTRLDRIVSDQPKHDGDRLVVADSKRVYSRNPRGARRLEATVLAFMAQIDPFGVGPRNGMEVISMGPPELDTGRETFAAHPWYAHLPKELPCHVPADRLALRRAQLAATLKRTSVQLIDGGVRVLPAGELNRSWRVTGNKSLSHWQVTGGVVRHLWQRLADEGLAMFVDRLGGRQHYGGLLAKLFPGARVERLCETSPLSEYRVTQSPRRMRIAFAERCEERSFAVALASCFAKYARELSMEAFNSYFADLQPGLRPTAGYTTDGRRWLEEAQSAVERAGVDRALLVRER
jgi:hypothetical protein